MKQECVALRKIRIGDKLVQAGDVVKEPDHMQADLVARGWAEMRAAGSPTAEKPAAGAATGDKE